MIRLFLSLGLLTAICSISQAQAPVEVKAHTALVHHIAFSADGKFFATAGFDKTAKLFDYNNGAPKELKTFGGHTDPVYCVAFTPDGKQLATSSLDKTV